MENTQNRRKMLEEVDGALEVSEKKEDEQP